MIYEKPFLQPTHLKLMCKQDNSQSFTIPDVEAPACSPLFCSFIWTKVVQKGKLDPSCSLGSPRQKGWSAVIVWLMCRCMCTVGQLLVIFLIMVFKKNSI